MAIGNHTAAHLSLPLTSSLLSISWMRLACADLFCGSVARLLLLLGALPLPLRPSPLLLPAMYVCRRPRPSFRLCPCVPCLCFCAQSTFALPVDRFAFAPARCPAHAQTRRSNSKQTINFRILEAIETPTLGQVQNKSLAWSITFILGTRLTPIFLHNCKTLRNNFYLHL